MFTDEMMTVNLVFIMRNSKSSSGSLDFDDFAPMLD